MEPIPDVIHHMHTYTRDEAVEMFGPGKYGSKVYLLTTFVPCEDQSDMGETYFVHEESGALFKRDKTELIRYCN